MHNLRLQTFDRGLQYTQYFLIKSMMGWGVAQVPRGGWCTWCFSRTRHRGHVENVSQAFSSPPWHCQRFIGFESRWLSSLTIFDILFIGESWEHRKLVFIQPIASSHGRWTPTLISLSPVCLIHTNPRFPQLPSAQFCEVPWNSYDLRVRDWQLVFFQREIRTQYLVHFHFRFH